MTRVLGILAVAFVLVLVCTSGSYAQSTISIGGQLGLNLGSLSVDPEPTGVSIDRSTFFMIGGFGEFRFSGGFALQPELWYLMKGAEATGGGLTANISLGYIEVPVLAKYTFAGGGFKPHIFAGPYLAFNTSAEVESGGTTEKIDEFIESTDFGLVFGAGGEVSIAPKMALQFGARYSLGLSEIQTGDFFGTSTLKTDGIQITAGLKFDL